MNQVWREPSPRESALSLSVIATILHSPWTVEKLKKHQDGANLNQYYKNDGINLSSELRLDFGVQAVYYVC